MAKKEEKSQYLPEIPIYSTGDVQPPKNYRGIITVLLLLVLFLGSLVSALSFANIRLFELLQSADDSTSVRFMENVQLAAGAHDGIAGIPALGAKGYVLTAFEQRYYGLPQGIYVTQVEDPVRVGIRTGDVLLAVNGEPVTDTDVLNDLLEYHDPGRILFLDIYRKGARLSLDASQIFLSE